MGAVALCRGRSASNTPKSLHTRSTLRRPVWLVCVRRPDDGGNYGVVEVECDARLAEITWAGRPWEASPGQAVHDGRR